MFKNTPEAWLVDSVSVLLMVLALVLVVGGHNLGALLAGCLPVLMLIGVVALFGVCSRWQRKR